MFFSSNTSIVTSFSDMEKYCFMSDDKFIFLNLCNFWLQSYNFFLIYAREKANLGNFSRNYIVSEVVFVSVISRSSLGHRSVGKRQRMGGYKQGQGTHKTIQNGQKVIRSVIYINLTRPCINFCFRIVLIINMLKDVNINRKIWI